MSEGGQPRLLLGLTPLAERAVEEVLFAREPEVEVVASAADTGELLSLAERRGADAVLVSSELSGLSEAQCARLRTRGLRLLGLALDDGCVGALGALGIETVLHVPLETGELARAARDPRASAVAGVGVERRLVAVESRETSERRPGGIVAVVGSAGSPGASECAASLAALASRRWRTLLVELDLLGGALDLRLGCDSHRGSLLGLVRATAADGALGELLERWTCGGERGWPPVLLAPPDLDTHIDELEQPGAIQSALEAAAALYPLLVCDVGSLLASPGELPKAARCHREALLAADAVILVLGARDDQLRAGRNQLGVLLDGLGIKRERLRVCVSGAGGPGTGRRAELDHALAGELAELRLAVDAWLPFDRRGLGRARRLGLPLALVRERGPYTRALGRLLDDLLLPVRPVPRERKERLPVPAADPAATKPAPVAAEEVQLPWRS